MKTIALGTFIVLFVIIAGISTMPTVFASHATAEVSIPAGTSVPGCEETDECWLPATVTIDVGGEVTWSNDDTAAHTVTSGSAVDGPDGVFDSSLFVAGDTFSVKFDDFEPGEYPYFCMVHPWMAGTVIVEAAEMMMDGMMEGGPDEIMVEIETGSAGKGEIVTIDVTFTDMEGGGVQHANYDIIASQGNEVVLEVMGAHEHMGIGSHTTAPLPLAASETMPLNIEVTFNGFGLEEPFTGPIGEVATKKIIPEFGTIAMMILGVSIVSIIAISAKSRVFPKV